MRITERDRKVFAALDKLRVLDIETAASLCGFTQYCKCAERLAILYENGYVDYYQQGMTSKKYYYIKQKGMNVIYPGEKRINKKGKEYFYYKNPPSFGLNNINHEIQTAKVLSYILKCNPQLTMDDFKTDREMMVIDPKKGIVSRHVCDLQCDKYYVKVEVELSKKSRNKVRRNIMYNNDNYVQVWIAGNNSVYDFLIKEKKRYPEFSIHVIKLEELENTPIILSELHDELLKNKPELLERMKKIERLAKERNVQK